MLDLKEREREMRSERSEGVEGAVVRMSVCDGTWEKKKKCCLSYDT